MVRPRAPSSSGSKCSAYSPPLTTTIHATVLDTARVFPPTTPVPELRGSFLYRLMRPEFVKNYRTPLCSDAFSRFEAIYFLWAL